MSSSSRHSSGITGLDEVLGGGFPAGQMYLIEGNPGAGKTTLGLQFLRAGVAAGDRCCYVVLSESEKALSRLASSHGWNLDGIDVVESNDQDPRSDYSIYEPSEVELGESSRSLFTKLTELAPQRVVVDSLSEVRLIAQDPLRYRRQLLAMRRFFDQRGMTVLLLDFLSSVVDHQLESLCHGIVNLEQLAPEYGGQRRRLRVSKLRESKFRDGFHDISIETGGMQVYPRLVAAEHARHERHPQRVVSTGVRELDGLMGGGVDRGTSMLIMGPAGCGKSTVALQLARAGVARGEKTAIFTFDELPNTLILRGEGMGMPVRADIEAGRISVRQIDTAELSPGQLTHLIRDAVERQGVTTVIIDSINGYQNAMPEEHHLAAHLHELLAYLCQNQVVAVLVMTQSGLVGNRVESPIDLSYLADSVLLLRYFEVRGEIRQAISMVKRRTGPHERTIRELLLDGSGIRVGEPLSEFEGIIGGALIYTGGAAMLPGR